MNNCPKCGCLLNEDVMMCSCGYHVLWNELFSFQGRINRATFWLYLLPLNLLGLTGIMLNWLFPANNLLYHICMLITCWPALALNVKRCHDRGRSGWFFLITLIPLLNVWYLIEIGFLTGQYGQNRFGPDPLPTYRPIRVLHRTMPILAILLGICGLGFALSVMGRAGSSYSSHGFTNVMYGMCSLMLASQAVIFYVMAKFWGQAINDSNRYDPLPSISEGRILSMLHRFLLLWGIGVIGVLVWVCGSWRLGEYLQISYGLFAVVMVGQTLILSQILQVGKHLREQVQGGRQTTPAKISFLMRVMPWGLVIVGITAWLTVVARPFSRTAQAEHAFFMLLYTMFLAGILSQAVMLDESLKMIAISRIGGDHANSHGLWRGNSYLIRGIFLLIGSVVLVRMLSYPAILANILPFSTGITYSPIPPAFLAGYLAFAFLVGGSVVAVYYMMTFQKKHVTLKDVSHTALLNKNTAPSPAMHTHFTQQAFLLFPFLAMIVLPYLIVCARLWQVFSRVRRSSLAPMTQILMILALYLLIIFLLGSMEHVGKKRQGSVMLGLGVWFHGVLLVMLFDVFPVLYVRLPLPYLPDLVPIFQTYIIGSLVMNIVLVWASTRNHTGFELKQAGTSSAQTSPGEPHSVAEDRSHKPPPLPTTSDAPPPSTTGKSKPPSEPPALASTLYQVTFRGEILDGYTVKQVKGNLGRLFKTDAQQIEKLFRGTPVTIKKGIDAQSALKYQRAFKKAGARCRITQMPVSVEQPPLEAPQQNQPSERIHPASTTPPSSVPEPELPLDRTVSDVLNQWVIVRRDTPQLAAYIPGQFTQQFRGRYLVGFVYEDANGHPTIQLEMFCRVGPDGALIKTQTMPGGHSNTMMNVRLHERLRQTPAALLTPIQRQQLDLPNIPGWLNKIEEERRAFQKQNVSESSKTGFPDKKTVMTSRRPGWLLVAGMLLMILLAGIAIIIQWFPNVPQFKKTQPVVDAVSLEKDAVTGTKKTMRLIGTGLGSFQVDYAAFPVQDEWGPWNSNILSSDYYSGISQDDWGTDFQYWSNGKSYQLISYGADLKKGGSGLDADIILENGAFIANAQSVVEMPREEAQTSASSSQPVSLSTPSPARRARQSFHDVGFVLELDGMNDYVVIPDSDTYEKPTGTMAIWLNTSTDYTSSAQHNDYVLGKQMQCSGGCGSTFALSFPGAYHTPGATGTIKFWIRDADEANSMYLESSTPLNDGQWHCIIMQWGASGMKLYVDGTLHDSHSFTGWWDGNSKSLYLGAIRGQHHFAGKIAEVSIWDRSLTQEEIQGMMNAPLQGTESGLLAYWHVDEGEGQIVGDAVGNNDGQLGAAGTRDSSDPVWTMDTLSFDNE